MTSTTPVAIDKAGRLVVPKAIRDEAGIEPGMPLHISVRDGRIEIEPEFAKVRLVKKGRLTVIERVEPGPPITERAVRALSHRLRDRRDKKW